MTLNRVDSQTDEWSDWLLHGRHANDPDFERIVRVAINRVADYVLDAAELAPGMTVADIGSGDGLVAFRAIERIGPSLNVILTDISVPLLRHAEMLATERGVHDQCTFLHCSAEKLDEIPDASVDVVTVRAVLAYVTDKMAALREFHRILKPGGRLAISDPILRDAAIEVIALKNLIDAQPAESKDRFLSIVHRWKAAQFPDTVEKMANSPITNYTERDLVQFVKGAGFAKIHLQFHIDIAPDTNTSWNILLGHRPHPWASPVGTVLLEQCSSDERAIFEQVMRPVLESGQFNSIERAAYITATKAEG